MSSTSTVSLDVALRQMYAGLRARPTPQQVARTIVDAGLGTGLPASAARELTALASTTRVGTSMSGTFYTHPGLGRAYAVAAAAVGTICDTLGVARLIDADPSNPDDLGRWLVDAHDLLHLDLGTVRPAAPTTHRVPSERVLHDSWTFEQAPSWLPVTAAAGQVVPFVDAGALRCSYEFHQDGSVTEHTAFTRWGMHRARGPRGEHGGHVDVRTKLPAAERRALLPGVSVRAYRSAVRAVAHLDQRTRVLADQRDREAAVRYGKSRLATAVGFEDFAACPATAAFVGYYTSRLTARTVFTNGSQDRPMDDVAAALFDRARAASTYRPDVVAHVLCRADVLAACTPTQLADLTEATWEAMTRAAGALKGAWDPKRPTMVVRAGDDSTTWNTASRAFNQARTGWLALLRAAGRVGLLKQVLPGKVPALIAADVAAWHEGGEHVDTDVYRLLPAPWDVVLGQATCTRAMVEDACARMGVDPLTTGWTAPYQQDELAVSAPAPDLVHGVVVAEPAIAVAMREAGWFSGT